MQVFQITRPDQAARYEGAISDARKVAKDGLPNKAVATITVVETGKLSPSRLAALFNELGEDGVQRTGLVESTSDIENHIGQPTAEVAAGDDTTE